MKRDYSYKDHFKFGWGDGTYNFSENDLTYWVKFGKAERIPGDFRTECVNAARLIGQSAEKPVMVCFSGGIDSEIILTSMIEAGVKCKALIANIIHEGVVVNAHDTKYAFEYVEKHNVDHLVYDFDLADFFRNRLLADVINYRAPRPGLLIHADLVRTFSKNYLCVLGGGDLHFYRGEFNNKPEFSEMYVTEEQVSVSAIHAAVDLGETVVSRFFMYTPELMLSWLLNNDIKNFIKNEKAFTTITSYNIKPFIFHKLWPELIPRPKYTGFENINLFHREQMNTCDPELLQIMRTAIKTIFPSNTIYYQYSELLNILSPNENSTSVL
jgi:hypothetical protein